MTYLKIAGAVLTVLLAFGGGYRYAAALYGEDIAALREDYAERASALQSQYREKEATNAKNLVAAWEARDKALADADGLRDAVDRVRLEADRARRKLSRADAGACAPERERLARGASLVGRCAELLERGAGLAQRVAIDKDALAALK